MERAPLARVEGTVGRFLLAVQKVLDKRLDGPNNEKDSLFTTSAGPGFDRLPQVIL